MATPASTLVVTPNLSDEVGVLREGPTAAEEWRAHWPMVSAAMAGLSFASIAVSSIGLFMEPLSQEFGWSRAAISGGLTIFAAVAVPLAPVAGMLIDRFGSRRIAIPGLTLSALMLAAFSQANGSIAQWMMLWGLYALVAVSIKTPVWTTAVTSAFVTGRGLALAVTLCGTAVAQTLSPILAQFLISTQGWRAAYRWIAFGWGSTALVLILLFLFDARDRQRRLSPAASRAAPLPVLYGLGLREAVRSTALIRIATATFLINLVVGGQLIHLVPLLKGNGLSATVAAGVAGAAGIASLSGKLFTGWLLDRFHGSRIAVVTLALPSLAFFILLNAGSTMALSVLAVAMLGYVMGAELQLCVYLTGRYAGLRSFGKVFGIMSGLIALGIGIGPVIAGLIFDRVGSYAPMLIFGMPISLLCTLLVARLGPYPEWTAATRSAAGASVKP